MQKEKLKKGDVTRLAIEDAALELYMEQGYHATSMRQIADRSGLALGGIYNHFGGKEQIFEALIVDRHPVHRSRKVSAWLEKCPDRIRLFFLPGYSPELNPIEQYWKNVKRHLGTKPIFDKVQLLTELKKALRKNIFMPDISDY